VTVICEVQSWVVFKSSLNLITSPNPTIVTQTCDSMKICGSHGNDYEKCLLFSSTWHSVVWSKFTEIFEEHTVLIFRVKA
jgi:hypothetical protein